MDRAAEDVCPGSGVKPDGGELGTQILLKVGLSLTRNRVAVSTLGTDCRCDLGVQRAPVLGRCSVGRLGTHP